MSFQGKKHSEETKQKMREASKGKVFTEEHKQHIREAKSTPEAIAHNIEVHTGRKRSEESRRNMSVAAQASPKFRERMAKLCESNRGKPIGKGIPKSEAHKQSMRGRKTSEATKQKMREAHLGLEVSEETRQKLSAAWKGKKRGPMSEDHKRNLSIAKTGKPSWNKGVPKSEANKESLRQSPKFRAHLLRLLKDKGPTTLELFIEHRLSCHGGHPFEREAEIPGLFELYERSKPWDFLLPDKKIALELDGTYWHPARPERNFGWDCNKEAFFELYATLLGWRVVRIPEKVLRQSKPYRQWLRERNSERKAIKRACKPPRMRFNFATKAVKAKSAHFQRVKLRKAA